MVEQHGTQDSDTRALPLRWIERALLETEYDLGDKADRLRSVRNLERLFFDLAEALRPGLFVEAGAKDAGSSRRAKELLPKTRVVAFEANPYTYRRFQEINSKPPVTIEYLHRALSDAPGTAKFNVRKMPDGRPSADGQGSLNTRADYKPGYEEVEVEAVTLDQFFADDPSKQCVMWVDVEGACREVLRGARQLLSRTSVAFVEVETHPYWGDQWLDRDVIAYLYDAGLVPVARDFQSSKQYNILCVRREVLADPGAFFQIARHWYRTMPVMSTSTRAARALGRRAWKRIVQRRSDDGAR